MPNLNQFKTRKEFNEWYQNYRASLNWKKYHNEYNRKWREKNGTTKDAIRKKVLWAIKRGKLIKSPCEFCKSMKVEAHHDDYRSPLKVRWLCRKHHRQVDVAQGKRED